MSTMQEQLIGRFNELVTQLHEADVFEDMSGDVNQFMFYLYKVFCCGAVLGAHFSERDDVADAIVYQAVEPRSGEEAPKLH